MRELHLVVPEGIDDPARPSGGNIYDRRLSRGLTGLGWKVHEHAVPGAWPRPDSASLEVLARVIGCLPGDAVVLLDGLVASAVPQVLVPQAARLRLIVLVHMPLGHGPANAATQAARAKEREVLSAAAAVITTSAWARRRVLGLYRLPAAQVHVAEPGVDPAELAPGTPTGGALLCVAAVSAGKGHDVLLGALETISDLPWQCTCVGSLDRDPAFVEAVRRRVACAGLGDRMHFPGPRTGPDLHHSYASSDLLVLASRAETYGMVITEALARGLPAVATDVGGPAEALGHNARAIRPGMLVAPDDVEALGGALRTWLGHPDLRARLRGAALGRRDSLPKWSTTASSISRVLDGTSP